MAVLSYKSIKNPADFLPLSAPSEYAIYEDDTSETLPCPRFISKPLHLLLSGIRYRVFVATIQGIAKPLFKVRMAGNVHYPLFEDGSIMRQNMFRYVEHSLLTRKLDNMKKLDSI